MRLFHILITPEKYIIISYKSDVVQGKPTTQSSLSTGGVSSRAVDGNTNNNFWSGQSSTLTNTEIQPWWAVDLEQDFDIYQVVVHKRGDCCGGCTMTFL